MRRRIAAGVALIVAGLAVMFVKADTVKLGEEAPEVERWFV